MARANPPAGERHKDPVLVAASSQSPAAIGNANQDSEWRHVT